MKHSIVLTIFGIALLASASFTLPERSTPIPGPSLAPESQMNFARVSSLD